MHAAIAICFYYKVCKCVKHGAKHDAGIPTHGTRLCLSIIFYYHKLNCKGKVTLSHPRKDSEIILNLSRHYVVVKQEQIVARNDDYPFTFTLVASNNHFTIRNNHDREYKNELFAVCTSLRVHTCIQKPAKRTRMMRASQVHLVTNARLVIHTCLRMWIHICVRVYSREGDSSSTKA